MKKTSLLLFAFLFASFLPVAAEEYLFGIEGAYLTEVPPLGGFEITARGYHDLPGSLRLHYRLYSSAGGGILSVEALYDTRTYPFGYYAGVGIGYAFADASPVANTIIGVRYSPLELPAELYAEWEPTFPNLGILHLSAGLALRIFARGL